MSVLVLGLLLAADVAPKPYNGQPAISISLRSEAAEYFVGEPLRLQLLTRNDGPERIAGPFSIRFDQGDSSGIFWRHAGGSWEPLRVLSAEGKALAQARDIRGGSLVAVEPGGTREQTLTLAWAGGTGALVLSEPGRYEFKAVLPTPSRKAPLSSNIVYVQVLPAPPNDRAAFDEFVKRRLGEVAQSANRVVIRRDMARLNEISQFLAVYSDSIYAGYLRKWIWEALAQAVRTGDASDAQRAVYSKIKEEHPELVPSPHECEDDPDCDARRAHDRRDEDDHRGRNDKDCPDHNGGAHDCRDWGNDQHGDHDKVIDHEKDHR